MVCCFYRAPIMPWNSAWIAAPSWSCLGVIRTYRGCRLVRAVGIEPKVSVPKSWRMTALRLLPSSNWSQLSRSLSRTNPLRWCPNSAAATAGRMRMRPPSSNISASITPGLSRKSPRSISPFSTPSTASRLQSGHSDWVLLGTPTAIGVRSRSFRSRAGAQFGLGKSPSGNRLLNRFSRVANKGSFPKTLPLSSPDLTGLHRTVRADYS